MQRLYQISNLSDNRRIIFIQLRKYFLDISNIRNNFAIKVITVTFTLFEIVFISYKVLENGFQTLEIVLQMLERAFQMLERAFQTLENDLV